MVRRDHARSGDRAQAAINETIPCVPHQVISAAEARSAPARSSHHWPSPPHRWWSPQPRRSTGWRFPRHAAAADPSGRCSSSGKTRTGAATPCLLRSGRGIGLAVTSSQFERLTDARFAGYRLDSKPSEGLVVMNFEILRQVPVEPAALRRVKRVPATHPWAIAPVEGHVPSGHRLPSSSSTTDLHEPVCAKENDMPGGSKCPR